MCFCKTTHPPRPRTTATLFRHARDLDFFPTFGDWQRVLGFEPDSAVIADSGFPTSQHFLLTDHSGVCWHALIGHYPAHGSGRLGSRTRDDPRPDRKDWLPSRFGGDGSTRLRP